MALKRSCICFWDFVLCISWICVVSALSASHEFEINDRLDLEHFLSKDKLRIKRDATDPICKQREAQHMTGVTSGTVKLEQKYTFANETNYSLALAWCGNNGDILVVTSSMLFGDVKPSNIYRSDNFGKTFKDITKTNFNGKTPRILKHNGVQRNPHDTRKIYLVDAGMSPVGSILYITEDGGSTFHESQLPFGLNSLITFHPNKNYPDYLLASSSILTTKKLFVSYDNGRTWKRVADFVKSYKWGTGDDDPKTIYATVDPKKTHPFFATFVVIRYQLHKYNEDTNTKILDNVISFGHQGNFLYASIYDSLVNGNRIMKVSTDHGKSWNVAQLPTITGDRFFSVLDMNEKLVFLHVDNPGDTGHGTLYTSGGKGVIYSESLPKHLYPNYGSVTDFYRVESMRGVYITSQMSEDDSIHTMITYNRGATWQQIPRPKGAPCKDEKKPCHLQIHNVYSVQRGVLANTPMSSENAPGIILVHGHVADALQTTHPDVYVTSDGGYSWTKALDGPHHYQIADSGGLLVAIPSDTHMPDVVKFSTDEGRCWHKYKFIQNKSDAILITGLLTEPGNKALSVGIWGYHPVTKKWTVYVVDFDKIITTKCTYTDYEDWKPHFDYRKNENKDVQGCLLGKKETFKRIKKDSWCFNGYDYKIEQTGTVCICTREDYECDYGYYRPTGSDTCLKISSFRKPDIDICLRGHEEEIVTEGYRKLPGDVCKGGFVPSGKKIVMKAKCSEKSKILVLEDMKDAAPTKASSHNGSVIAAVVIIVVLLAVIMGVFLVHKYIILRRHRVVYRYSLLNQNEREHYDNEYESALSDTSKTVVYQDSSDDEELNSPAVRRETTNGNTRRSNPHGTKVKSYHDDSDVDMLE